MLGTDSRLGERKGWEKERGRIGTIPIFLEAKHEIQAQMGLGANKRILVSPEINSES